MLKTEDANGFRRTALGLCLIAAPLVGLVSALITPQFTGDLGDELSAISEHTGRWLIGEFLNLVAFFLFMIAVLGIIRLLRHRSTVLVYVGGGLMMFGAFFHGAVVGFALSEVPLAGSGLERETLTGLVGETYDSAAFTMILFPFLSFFLGSIVLAVAVWRAKVAPVWVPAALVAAPLSEFFGPEAASPELMFALFLVSFGYLGLKVLRLSGEDRKGDAALVAEPSRVM